MSHNFENCCFWALNLSLIEKNQSCKIHAGSENVKYFKKKKFLPPLFYEVKGHKLWSSNMDIEHREWKISISKQLLTMWSY